MKRWATAACFAAVAITAVAAPSPSTLEDARIERERLLRAADQLDFLATQIENLQGEIAKLRSEMDALRSENGELRRSLQEMAATHAADRQKLLDEVSQIVAKSSPAPKPEAKEAAAAPPASDPPPRQEKGYRHIVEKGQTVSAIARAYNAKGVKVTIEEIIRANDLSPEAVVRPGQELFIPKKD